MINVFKNGKGKKEGSVDFVPVGDVMCVRTCEVTGSVGERTGKRCGKVEEVEEEEE